MAENDKSLNNGETDREMIRGMTSMLPRRSCQNILSSIPPQEFPRPSHENTFGCCAQNDQCPNPKLLADVIWECYFSTTLLLRNLLAAGSEGQ